jgi:hypothetical protein
VAPWCVQASIGQLVAAGSGMHLDNNRSSAHATGAAIAACRWQYHVRRRQREGSLARAVGPVSIAPAAGLALVGAAAVDVCQIKCASH